MPPKHAPAEEEMEWRSKTGRVIAGVELRITADDGSVLPWDGVPDERWDERPLACVVLKDGESCGAAGDRIGL